MEYMSSNSLMSIQRVRYTRWNSLAKLKPFEQTNKNLRAVCMAKSVWVWRVLYNHKRIEDIYGLVKFPRTDAQCRALDLAKIQQIVLDEDMMWKVMTKWDGIRECYGIATVAPLRLRPYTLEPTLICGTHMIHCHRDLLRVTKVLGSSHVNIDLDVAPPVRHCRGAYAVDQLLRRVIYFACQSRRHG